MNTLGKRIAIAREKLGLNQSELARRLGVTPQAVQKWEMDSSKPRDKAIDTMVLIFGVSKQWLLLGGDTPNNEIATTTEDFAFIPFYDVTGSCGSGYINDHEVIKSELAFKKTWLKTENLQEKDLAIITAKGDSMWPTINEGDILLINTNYKRVESGRVYAIAVDDQVRVKRLFLGFGGDCRIVSDNPNKTLYPDETISPEILDKLHIVGRVIWVGGML